MSAQSPRERLVERQAMVMFVAGVAVIAATWLFGFALRAALWNTSEAIIRSPLMIKVYTNGYDANGNIIQNAKGEVGSLVLITLLLAVISAGYLACLWALRRGFRHSFAAALVGTAVACAALMPIVPLTSPDAVHLAADVRTFWLHGKYPTNVSGAPANIDDPIAGKVTSFRQGRSGYGPVAYVIGGVPIPFVGDGLAANVAGQKAVAAVFLVLAAALMGLVARRLGMNPGLAAAALGLNPLMVYVSAGEAHNDIMMAAFGLAGLVLVLDTSWRQRAGGVGMAGVAFLTKFSLALAGPLIAAWWYPRWRWVFAAATGLAIAAFALLVATENLSVVTSRLPGDAGVGPALATTRTSPWSILPDADPVTGDADTRRRFVAVAYGLLAVIVLAVIARHPLKTPADLPAAIATLMWLFIFAALPGYLPWYQAWYLPFAFLSGRRWLICTALVFSVGAFVPILALQWARFIIADMNISTPHHKAVIVLWVVTSATALGMFLWDRAEANRRRRDAAVSERRVRRAPPARPIRARR